MSFKRQLPKLIGVLVVIGVTLAIIAWLRDFLQQPAPVPKQVAQQITLLPPPPPPPKLEEKPPQPEIEPEPVEIEEPEAMEDLPDPVADDPPAGDNLGLDAEGGAGADGFGLIGLKGGRGLLAGAGDPHIAYAAQVQRRIEEALAEQKAVRRQAYSVVAKIWVDATGHIARAELAGSTGDTDVDRSLERNLIALPPLAQAPPADMPQPIRLRISSRL